MENKYCVDKITGVTIPKNNGKNTPNTFASLISYWMFGSQEERNVITQQVIENRPCLYEKYKLESCLKDNKECLGFLESLKDCQGKVKN